MIRRFVGLVLAAIAVAIPLSQAGPFFLSMYSSFIGK